MIEHESLASFIFRASTEKKGALVVGQCLLLIAISFKDFSQESKAVGLHSRVAENAAQVQCFFITGLCFFLFTHGVANAADMDEQHHLTFTLTDRMANLKRFGILFQSFLLLPHAVVDVTETCESC